MHFVPVTALSLAAMAFASVTAAEYQIGPHRFTLPDGFTIEQVATTDLVQRPIEMDMDEEGRLYVTDSSGSNASPAEQLKQKPHRIMRLEDTNGDGVFDQSKVFADKMMFPEGAMWFDGSLYVSAPPVIWKLTDTDGDGVADKREEWTDAKTLTGCANDLHGPYLGLDGWIYWAKGAFAEQSWDQANAAPFKTRAAHIFRRRPEGGLVEAVMTGGMDNPVGVAFSRDGERFFTTTFLQHPGGGRRDGMIHAIYGGVYGKVHDVLDGHKKSGELMPVLSHMGPAAPCGITRYESQVFGKDYQDNLFVTQFNLHKVSRHQLSPDGATYKSADSDFLVSDNPDFHPTDVMEDADGSLLVIDTGGWYKICCPTSQLYKPDVLGVIYRVRKMGAPKIDDPRGRKIEWKKRDRQRLPELLADPRPAVVKRALAEAARIGADAVAPLEAFVQSGKSLHGRINSVWALARIPGASSSAAILRALDDSDPAVQHAALQTISVRRDKSAAAAIALKLASADAGVRRAAAEALGRVGDSGSVAPLLEAAGKLASASGHSLPERVAEHSIIYALIELNRPDQTRLGLASANRFTRRAALIALDQMEDGRLEAGLVATLLNTEDPVLKETARWIVSRHHDWGKELAGYFEQRFARGKLSAAEEAEMAEQLSNLANDPAIQSVLGSVVGNVSLDPGARRVALRAMAGARLQSPPPVWADKLGAIILSDSDPARIEALKSVAGIYPKAAPVKLKEALGRVARDSNWGVGERLTALNAISAGTLLDDSLFDFAAGQLGREAVSTRGMATEVLVKSKLTESQLSRLADLLKEAGPLELSRLLGAFENPASEEVGIKLAAALRDGKALQSLHPDRVKAVFAKYSGKARSKGAEIVELLNADAAKQAARIDELLAEVPSGDIRRGQAIFNSTRAACSTCHAIGYLGGTIGPDLTRVGQVRTKRDLLEAIVYPSASFVRSFEPMTVATTDGESYNGVVRKDAPDEMVLATGPGAETRIPRAQIAAVSPGKVSIMPQGLDGQLTRQELADLLAFLEATKW